MAKLPDEISERITRPGGRSARVVDEVLRVTLEELGRAGYGALRVEEVAARSGVNKTTIYRRWPNKAALLAAAMAWLELTPVVNNSGDVRADLIRTFIDQLERVNTELVRGVVRMLQYEQGDPDVDATMREVKERHTAPRVERLRLAIDDGELPRGVDVELLNEVMARAIYGRLSRLSEVVTAEYIEAVVGLVLAGARA